MTTPTTDAHAAYQIWHDRLPVDSEADAPWHRLLKGHLLPDRDLAGKRILEIGCGRGGFACWLAGHPARPAEVVAADFAESALAKGREHAGRLGLTGLLWEVGDIQAIGHPDSSFDTVVSSETIEHVPDPKRALRELARVLRSGGRLFLTTPNYLGTMGLYRAYRRLRGRPFTEEGQPINNFMLLPLTRAWVKAAGLRVLTTDGVGHYLPVPRRPPVELPWLNNPRMLMRWFGLHSFILAEKP